MIVSKREVVTLKCKIAKCKSIEKREQFGRRGSRSTEILIHGLAVVLVLFRLCWFCSDYSGSVSIILDENRLQDQALVKGSFAYVGVGFVEVDEVDDSYGFYAGKAMKG